MRAFIFSVSEDGYHFTALNRNEKIITQTLGKKCCRDPFIFRDEDGGFHIIATDMRCYDGWSSNHSMVLWDSRFFLFSIGFSKKMIKTLLPEPALKPNPHYPSASPMREYKAEDVFAAMASEEFARMAEEHRKRSESASAAAEKAADTKEKRLAEHAKEIVPGLKVPSVNEKELLIRALENQVNLYGEKDWQMTACKNAHAYQGKYRDYCQSNQLTTPKEKHNFREYALKWFETYSAPNVATGTARQYNQYLNKYILPYFGNYDIEDITTDHVQRFFNSIEGAKTTKHKPKVVLNMIFDSAVDDDIIKKNPVKSSRLKIDGTASKDTPPYSVVEMQYIVAHIGDVKREQDRLFLALQVLHPLRLEEVLGLCWEDIDFNNKLLYIRRAVTHPKRNQPEVKEPKTEKSKRTIGLSATATDYLSLATNKKGFVVGGDTPLSYTKVRRMCERIQKDIQFDGKITPLRFRTTVLTDLYDRTKDIKLTQRTAGHATSTMTLKHYVKGRSSVSNSAQVIDDLYSL